MKEKAICDFCGKEFMRESCKLKGKKHHFCCRQCLANFSSKNKNPNGYRQLKSYENIGAHFSDLNKKLNPTRMCQETREKLRQAHLGKGECKGYSKIYGRLAHRVVAEQMIGRPLREEEVVHHRDGNRYNNAPENLMVFPSSAAHTRFHNELRWFLKEIERMEQEDAESE